VLDTKKFKRTKENFTCENCGFLVEGDGYTNHCPRCLWSKHVDINPGDRCSNCFGMMEPIDVFVKSLVTRVDHRAVLPRNSHDVYSVYIYVHGVA